MYKLEIDLIFFDRLFEILNMFLFLCRMYLNWEIKDFMFFIILILFIVCEFEIM